MNRLGKAILLLILIGVAGVAAIVRFNPGGPRTSVPAREADASPASRPTPAVTISPSGLAIPVAGVAPGALMDTFGDARGDGARSHGALDIMAPRGTPVLAAAGGTVEKIFESANGGHTIYVRSPDGRFVYYYAHLDAYAPDVGEGMYVAQGRQIGTVGSTGDASPEAPHLHFEVKRMGPGEAWHEGIAINPYPLLAGTAAAL